MKTSFLQNGLLFILNDEDHTAQIILAQEFYHDFYIPRSIFYDSKEYIIKSIKDYVFKNAKTIKYDENSEITAVGKEFANSSQVESISFPQSIIKFEKGWCKGISKLSHISISQKNKNFLYLNESLIIGKSNPDDNVYDTIIFARRNIEKVNIPSFIKHINSYAFSNCYFFHSIYFSENSELLSIGNGSFLRSVIKEIFIPNHVQIIGSKAFKKCIFLSKVTFSENSELKIIEKSAFSFCYKIKNIHIPKHVTKLNDKAFYNCQYLEKITFAEDSEMNFFGQDLFTSSSINTITIPPRVEILQYQTFNECHFLNSIRFDKNSELKKLCYLFFVDSPILEIEFPSKLETLEQDWCGCAFELTNVKISPDNQNFKFFDDKTKVIMGKSDKNEDLFDVVEFACRDITRFEFPSYIKEIKDSAFADCKKVKSFDLFNCKKINKISKQCFNSTEIMNIVIPENIQLIDDGAFFYCNFFSAEILGNNITINNEAIRECNNLLIIAIPNANEIMIHDMSIMEVSLSLFICPNSKIVNLDSQKL